MLKPKSLRIKAERTLGFSWPQIGALNLTKKVTEENRLLPISENHNYFNFFWQYCIFKGNIVIIITMITAAVIIIIFARNYI